jgi:phosphonate transport system permease protein
VRSSSDSLLSSPVRSSLIRAAWFTLAGLFVIALVASVQFLKLELLDIGNGLQLVLNFLSRAVPPEVDGLEVILRLLVETVAMAVVGTFIGLILAIGFALVATQARHGWRWASWLARGVVVVARAVPDVVFALLAVQLVGFGPLAGAIALSIGALGLLGRTLADAIDALPTQADDALRVAGASRWQVAFSSTLPRLMPQIITQGIYRLDISFRSSSLLGIVGAGGIGLALKATLGMLDYQAAFGVVLLMAAVILLMELLSTWLRSRIGRSAFPARERRVTLWALLAGVVVVFYAVPSWATGINDLARRLEGGLIIFGQLFTPDFVTMGDQIWLGFGQSVAMAFLTTQSGFAIALTLGVLAASRPLYLPRFAIAVRALITLLRSIPTLIYTIIFLVAIGFGPETPFLAITLGVGVLMSRFVVDTLEAVDRDKIDKLYQAGANRIQVLVITLAQLARKPLASNYLYTFDLTFRFSVAVGVVGAIGLGSVVFGAARVLDFSSVSAAAILIVGFVSITEALNAGVKRLAR